MEFISSRRITKYEKARILGTRANQICLNAPVFIDTKGEIDPLKIAEMEFNEKKIPITIIRLLPNGTIEELSNKDWYDLT